MALVFAGTTLSLAAVFFGYKFARMQIVQWRNDDLPMRVVGIMTSAWYLGLVAMGGYLVGANWSP